MHACAAAVGAPVRVIDGFSNFGEVHRASVEEKELAAAVTALDARVGTRHEPDNRVSEELPMVNARGRKGSVQQQRRCIREQERAGGYGHKEASMRLTKRLPCDLDGLKRVLICSA